MKRIKMTEHEWDLLWRITESAKMDWFCEECSEPVYKGGILIEVKPKKTISQSNASDAGCAFIRENMDGLTLVELLDLYAFFKKAGVADDCMRNELVEHLLATHKRGA